MTISRRIIARKKPVEFTAYQWDGDLNKLVETFPHIRLLRECGTTFVIVDASSADRKLGLRQHDPAGRVKKAPENGDWIIEAGERMYHIEAEDFKARYEVVS